MEAGLGRPRQKFTRKKENVGLGKARPLVIYDRTRQCGKLRANNSKAFKSELQGSRLWVIVPYHTEELLTQILDCGVKFLAQFSSSVKWVSSEIVGKIK